MPALPLSGSLAQRLRLTYGNRETVTDAHRGEWIYGPDTTVIRYRDSGVYLHHDISMAWKNLLVKHKYRNLTLDTSWWMCDTSAQQRKPWSTEMEKKNG
jgi:hypothetical protein